MKKKIEVELFGDFKKVSKNSKTEVFEQCQSAENCKRDDPLDFLHMHSAEKKPKEKNSQRWYP